MPGEERGKRFVSKKLWYVKRRPFATLHKNLTSVDASSSQFETDRGNWRGVVGSGGGLNSVVGVSVLSIKLEYIHDACRRRPYGSDGQKPIEACFYKLFLRGVFMLWLGLWEFLWFGICSSTFSSEGEGFFSLHGGEKRGIALKVFVMYLRCFFFGVLHVFKQGFVADNCLLVIV